MIRNIILPTNVTPTVLITGYRDLGEWGEKLLLKLSTREYVKNDINIVIDDTYHNTVIEENYQLDFFKWQNYIINKVDILILKLDAEKSEEEVYAHVADYAISDTMFNKFLLVDCSDIMDKIDLVENLNNLQNSSDLRASLAFTTNETEFMNALNYLVSGIFDLSIYQVNIETSEETEEVESEEFQELTAEEIEAVEEYNENVDNESIQEYEYDLTENDNECESCSEHCCNHKED